MMRDVGFKADTLTYNSCYNSLLNAYVTKGDVNGARKVLAIMHDAGSTATR